MLRSAARVIGIVPDWGGIYRIAMTLCWAPGRRARRYLQLANDHQWEHVPCGLVVLRDRSSDFSVPALAMGVAAGDMGPAVMADLPTGSASHPDAFRPGGRPWTTRRRTRRVMHTLLTPNGCAAALRATSRFSAPPICSRSRIWVTASAKLERCGSFRCRGRRSSCSRCPPPPDASVAAVCLSPR